MGTSAYLSNTAHSTSKIVQVQLVHVNLAGTVHIERVKKTI